MRRRLPSSNLLLAASFVATSLSAQTLLGELAGAVTGQPVAYALLLLVDSTGHERVRTLSDGVGHFVLVAPAPGTYRVRVLRIGYRSFESPTMTLDVGERRYNAALPDVAIALPAVTVEAEKRCRVRPPSGPGEGETVAALLEQSQTVLGLVELAVKRRLFRFRSALFERSLGTNLVVTNQTGDTSMGFSAWPFESVPADSLVGNGFVQGGPNGPTYYSPDASVFFSDAFLDTHCFSVEKHRTDSTLIGLRFEPVRKRKLPDVRGVLWLERSRTELRRLDYNYTGLEGWVPTNLTGGWVEFRRLPNGAPLIVGWQIRAPIPMSSGGERKLFGFKEREGRVVNVFTADGHPVTLP
jgi:carboxypeptidase family protein